jgi:hypothetical protein
LGDVANTAAGIMVVAKAFGGGGAALANKFPMCPLDFTAALARLRLLVALAMNSEDQPKAPAIINTSESPMSSGNRDMISS